jgi:hypothetical protein
MGKETPKAREGSDDTCPGPVHLRYTGRPNTVGGQRHSVVQAAGLALKAQTPSAVAGGLSCLNDVWVPVAAVAIQRFDCGRFPRRPS